MRYCKKYVAVASVCDSVPKLSVVGAFQIVQDAVCDFFVSKNIDGITLKEKYNAMWVFAKNKVQFFKIIEYNKSFSVECFISSVGAVTMFIDTIFKDECGEILLYSRIEACAMDISSQRVIRLSNINIDSNMQEIAPIKVEMQKKDVQNAVKVETVKVQSTSIDMSNHTNNVEYIRFLLNSYSIYQLKNFNLKSVAINYISQSFAEDVLTINKMQIDNKDLFLITNLEGKIIVKAEFEFLS